MSNNDLLPWIPNGLLQHINHIKFVYSNYHKKHTIFKLYYTVNLFQNRNQDSEYALKVMDPYYIWMDFQQLL